METKYSVLKYQEKNSIVHNLDPRIKLLSYIMMIAIIFLPIGMTGAVIAFTWISVVLVLSKLKFMIYIKTFIPSLFIISFIYLINILTIEPIEEALWITTIYFVKLWSMLIVGSIFTSTSTESEISYSFSWFLTPLKLIKVPVKEISMILSLGLRFIPNIFTEITTIFNSMSLRGVDMSGWNIKNKFKGIGQMFLPLMVNSFKRADEISNAMLIKGYEVGKKRTSYIKYNFSLKDFLILFVVGVVLSFMIFLLVDGGNIIPHFADNWVKF